MQILLFSATFDDTVKRFAMKVVTGANQASGACCPGAAMDQWCPSLLSVLVSRLAAGLCAQGGAVARCHQAVHSGEGSCVAFWHLHGFGPTNSMCFLAHVRLFTNVSAQAQPAANGSRWMLHVLSAALPDAG